MCIRDRYTTVDALRRAGVTQGKMPEVDENGFYKNAMGGKTRMTRDKLNALKAGKKTTNMRAKLKVGKTMKRTYPFYEDPNDPTTVRFIVRTLERLQ
jgi:hypothetical protein